MNRLSGKYFHSLLVSLMVGIIFVPASTFAQSLGQLIEGAKKEGSLVLSWGTGTMGGIEGVRVIEKAFAKTYGLESAIQVYSRPRDAAVCQPDHSRGKGRSTRVQRSLYRLGESRRANVVEEIRVDQGVSSYHKGDADWDERVLVVVSRTPGFYLQHQSRRRQRSSTESRGRVQPKVEGKNRVDSLCGVIRPPGARIWGEEKTTSFLRTFVKHVAGLIRCGEEERVANGEFAMLVFNCDLADANEMQQKGAPANGRIFKDAGIFHIGT